MTKEQLAEALDGVQYGEEDDLINSLEAESPEQDLVVVFGHSDDCVEIRGALNDEYGCSIYGPAFSLYYNFEEKMVSFTESLYGIVEDQHSILHGLFKIFGRKMLSVNSFVDPDEEYLFKFEPDNIPFSPFKVMDDGDLYCIGCVFSLEDVKKELGVGNE